jgi:hypothetical protein
MTNAHQNSVGKPEGQNNSGHLGVDRSVILKLILKK